MRRNRKVYHVVLVIESRYDVDDDWNVEEKVLFTCKIHDIGYWWMVRHSYMNTDLEPNDNGEDWCYIQTLRLRRIR